MCRRPHDVRERRHLPDEDLLRPELLEVLVPGESMPASEQRKLLKKGAHQMMGLLERQYAHPSPVAAALKLNPGDPVLQAWSKSEAGQLNLQYEDVEYLLSAEANDEDWRDIWLFGFGG